MNYLEQFEKDFWSGNIPIRHHYNFGKILDKKDNIIDIDDDVVNQKKDVIYDLNTDCKPVSAACLAVAKQIATSEKKLNVKIPRLGDLFIGILHQPTIAKILFNLHNHNEIINIDGVLKYHNNEFIWVFTQLPLPFICVNDSDAIYLEVEIYLNDNYNLQTANQEVFKAYYGYLNHPIQHHMIMNAKYNIKLFDDISHLILICGFWTVSPNQNNHSKELDNKSNNDPK